MKKTMIESEFIGGGEVRDFKFVRIMFTEHANMYQVTPPDAKCHYEVFKVKFAPVCIDFENRIYSEDEFKQIYPKAKDFGKWAWTYNDYEKAIEKYNELIHV